MGVTKSPPSLLNSYFSLLGQSTPSIGHAFLVSLDSLGMRRASNLLILCLAVGLLFFLTLLDHSLIGIGLIQACKHSGTLFIHSFIR